MGVNIVVVIYFLGAFGLAIGAVFAVIALVQLGRNRPDGILIYFTVPIAIVTAVSTYTSGRNLTLANEMMLVMATPDPIANWMQRLTSIFLLAAAAERIASFVFKSRASNLPQGLMMAFIAFWIGTVAIPAGIGERPSFSHEYVYSLLIGIAALLGTEGGARRAIIVARNILLLFMIAGLVLVLIKKELVVGTYGRAIIPGVDMRYSGLTSGPNAMGPIAVLSMIAVWAFPFRRHWLQLLAWPVIIATLLMTQSKTSWIAALICAAIMGFQPNGSIRLFFLNPNRRLVAIASFFLFGGLVVFLLLIGSDALSNKIDKLLQTKEGNDLVTLTGRNEIWDVAIETWLANPLFGYGPEIWDIQFRRKIGIIAAAHAHNQILNILAASGVVGFLGFLVYGVEMLRRLWFRINSYNGFTASLFVLIAIRSFSEVPLSLISFGGESIYHVLLLMCLAGAPSLRRPMANSLQMDKKIIGSVRA